MSNLYSIEKLTATNYASWKVMIQMVLIEKELWDLVSQDIPQPGDQASNAEKLEWKKKADKARAIIVLSISTSELVHITNITNPVEI